MPRNFQRRVEVMFPVEDEGLRDRVVDEILGIALADNAKARRLLPDGSYLRVRPEAINGTNGTDASASNGTHAAATKLVRSQVRFMELAREKAHAAPALPGGNGGYHIRGTPLPRAAAAPPATAGPPTTGPSST
jgi:polyphosphate kinase